MAEITAEHRKTIRALARLSGIELRYRDGMGVVREVPLSTLQTLLTAMGEMVSTYDEERQSLKARRLKSWTRILDEVCLVWENQRSPTWKVCLPLVEKDLSKLRVQWKLEQENGYQWEEEVCVSDLTLSETRKIGKVVYGRWLIPFPEKLPLGYYRLTISAFLKGQSLHDEAWVIVAPKQCFVPDHPRRAWGVTAQLYGLTSSRNWGIGDFTDLSRVVSWVGRSLGANMIGINPLHALSASSISPYSPSSRLFLNPLYLDIEAIQELQEAPDLQTRVNSEEFQRRVQALRDSPTVDYVGVRDLKFPFLESLFRVFRQNHLGKGTEREQAFETFVQQQGLPLRRFAVFQVLQEHFPSKRWQEWPVDYQNAASPAVEAFAIDHQERVQFHEYVQWQCAEQLTAVNTLAKEAGMAFGLYHDLAVGIDAHGADAWMFQDQLARGVSIGAPPDSFNLSGQNWALQPPIPSRLRTHGYQFFKDTIRQNMQFGGMLRLDHVLGLFRTFWIPDGKSPLEGAYVRYPSDELLAIVALESVRHRVMVVGEDLGTVTPEIRRKFASFGLLSYRLLMFEKLGEKRFRSPQGFPEQALASVNTHDLPTLRGFWMGRDIETKEQIGLYPSVSHRDRDRETRIRDRQALFHALKRERLLPSGLPIRADKVSQLSDELCRAIYAYMARTPSRMVAVSLEDLLGEVDTPNVPGAPEGAYPVWQRKLHRPLEEWAHDPSLADFAAALRHERERSSLLAHPM